MHRYLAIAFKCDYIADGQAVSLKILRTGEVEHLKQFFQNLVVWHILPHGGQISIVGDLVMLRVRRFASTIQLPHRSKYHLIASEGTETEPQYFGAIQRIINSKYRDRIQLKVEGIGDNTVNLLMKARQYVQNNGVVFKHVWIVYDTDDFPAENIDMVAQLCQEYNAQGETIYHAVWSNQCVELWYLLHFMYMDTDIDRSRYWPKLSDCLKNMGAGSYEKNRPDMYEVLRPYMDIAIANAKRLDKQNEGRKPSESAPGTKVYELVEMLRPYLLDTQ